MCGLCGELRFDGITPDLSVIERMKQQLAKRGPDAEGAWSAAEVELSLPAAWPPASKNPSAFNPDIIPYASIQSRHYFSVGTGLICCVTMLAPAAPAPRLNPLR